MADVVITANKRNSRIIDDVQYTIYHCCMELDKILDLTLKGEKVLNLNEAATYKFVREQKALGYKYFSSCNNRDKEGRCAGHPN